MSGSTPVTSAGPERPTRRSRRPARFHRAAPVLLLVLGAAALFGASGLGLGELTQPGPGLWPFLVAIVLTGAAAVLVFIDPVEDYEPWTVGTVRIIAGLVGLGIFILLFQAVGFLLPAFLMLALWLRFFGDESWPWSLGLAAAGAIVMYLLFVQALGVPFPSGPLESVIGG